MNCCKLVPGDQQNDPSRLLKGTNMNLRPFFYLLLVFLAFQIGCNTSTPKYQIIISPEAGNTEKFAAREMRRYLYQRTDELLRIIESNHIPKSYENTIVITQVKSPVLDIVEFTNVKSAIKDLTEQEYLIRSVKLGGRRILLVVGGGNAGVLYGTYKLLEKYGIRFYLHGDVIPDGKIAMELPMINTDGKPLFQLRGILPFHDFPEGPDWWNYDDYMAIISQLPKMGMNFIGFHTYPETPPGSWVKAEPMVWIGTKDQVNNDGSVKAAYPVLHANTADTIWGNVPEKTSSFHFGTAALFDTDVYGADYMKNVSSWPHAEEENIRIFDQFGQLLNKSFSFAHEMEVKTCVGTETPLIIPGYLQKKLQSENIDPSGEAAIEMVYEGVFTRIKKAYPLDYYWMWTPEYWTWQGEMRSSCTIRNKICFQLSKLLSKLKLPSSWLLAVGCWVLLLTVLCLIKYYQKKYLLAALTVKLALVRLNLDLKRFPGGQSGQSPGSRTIRHLRHLNYGRAGRARMQQMHYVTGVRV